MESEQNACLPHQTVLLHVIDVGHGLAVLVELRDKTKHGNDVVELNLVAQFNISCKGIAKLFVVIYIYTPVVSDEHSLVGYTCMSVNGCLPFKCLTRMRERVQWILHLAKQI